MPNKRNKKGVEVKDIPSGIRLKREIDIITPADNERKKGIKASWYLEGK